MPIADDTHLQKKPSLILPTTNEIRKNTIYNNTVSLAHVRWYWHERYSQLQDRHVPVDRRLLPNSGVGPPFALYLLKVLDLVLTLAQLGYTRRPLPRNLSSGGGKDPGSRTES